jgi:hypothetical protein
MKIEWEVLETDFDGKTCFTLARGAQLPSGENFITTQPLLLSGCDVFYGIHTIRREEGGAWSKPVSSKTLIRQKISSTVEEAVCDMTPLYHRKTGKLLLIGHTVRYKDDKEPAPLGRFTAWSIYDFEQNDWKPYQRLDMGDEFEYFSAGNGSGQSWELPDGDLLIPFYYQNAEEGLDSWHNCYKAAVMRCGFDGAELTVKGIGSPLTVDVPRGLCEPSVIAFNGEYFLALRNDLHGYISRGVDGLHYEKPVLLTFDDGSDAGNYCTQQHWIVCGGKLYLVYTRKGADNDHVFRHRAPLFIAQVDTGTMTLLRHTEQIAVPERGARLGNFGVTQISENKAIITVTEWMQPAGCENYGSNNALFVTTVEAD